MAKSQKHGNKEAKKPKQIKTAAAAPADGLNRAGLGGNAGKKKN